MLIWFFPHVKNIFRYSMGHVLSKEEVQVLQPHLLGFNPSSLAAVIWDTIQEVSQDNKDEGLGIHFSTTSEGHHETPMVTFWDELGVGQLPRKVFLEILQFIGEFTMNSVSKNTPDLQVLSVTTHDLHRLKLALNELNIKLASLTSEEGSAIYRRRIDSGIDIGSNTTSVAGSAEILDKLRVNNGSCDWINSEDDAFLPQNPHLSQHGNRGSKGMEAVVERLPELRTRYERSLSVESDRNVLQQRVLGKLKVLSVLKSGRTSSPMHSTVSRSTTSSSISTNSDRLRGSSIDEKGHPSDDTQ